jgi:transposase
MPILNAIIVVGAVGLTTVDWRIAMKTYRPWAPEQASLISPSPSDWLPEGHLVYFLLDIVRELDLGAILCAIDAKDARGEKPYSPIMMVTLLLYAYCVGVFSSRRIERATHEDVAFRVLCGGEHPHFTRIADFRRTHIDAFRGIFVATLLSWPTCAVRGSRMLAVARSQSGGRCGEKVLRLGSDGQSGSGAGSSIILLQARSDSLCRDGGSAMMTSSAGFVRSFFSAHAPTLQDNMSIAPNVASS